MQLRLQILCAGLPMLLIGCGGGPNDTPELAPVTGTVTLGGQPLPDATIVFTPKEGAPSAGRTDSSGRYELIFSRSEKGAKVGEHTVRISTYQAGGEDQQAVPEKVPAQYNVKSQLTKAVENTGNVIDFELEAGGQVVEPSKEE